jgi:hypothetical protein
MPHPAPIASDPNAEDTTHKHVDILSRLWHRHMCGAIYCQGQRILEIVETVHKTVVVTATCSMDIIIAGELHRRWNENVR